MRVQVVALLVGSLVGAGLGVTGGGAADDTPHIEEGTWTGHVACQGELPQGTGFGCSPDNRVHHEIPVGADLRTLIVRVDWTPHGDAPAQALSLRVWREYAPPQSVGVVHFVHTYTYADRVMAPGETLRLDAGLHGDPANDFANIEGPWTLFLDVWAADGPALVIDQTFTATYALHHQAHAAPWPPAPRIDTGSWHGALSADLNPAIIEACRVGDGSMLHVPVEPGLKTLIVALDWQPADAALNLGTDLRLHLGHESAAHAGHSALVGHHPITSTVGPPTLQLRVDAGDTTSSHDPGALHRDAVYYLHVCNGTHDNVVLDQPFTGRYALFYHEPAPADLMLEVRP